MTNELTTTQKTATFIRKITDWQGDAALYELSHPMRESWGEDEDECKFVIVSAVMAFDHGGAETFIFPAKDADATDALSFSELPGSTRGTLDHIEVLNRCGYEVTPELIVSPDTGT